MEDNINGIHYSQAKANYKIKFNNKAGSNTVQGRVEFVSSTFLFPIERDIQNKIKHNLDAFLPELGEYCSIETQPGALYFEVIPGKLSEFYQLLNGALARAIFKSCGVADNYKVSDLAIKPLQMEVVTTITPAEPAKLAASSPQTTSTPAAKPAAVLAPASAPTVAPASTVTPTMQSPALEVKSDQKPCAFKVDDDGKIDIAYVPIERHGTKVTMNYPLLNVPKSYPPQYQFLQLAQALEEACKPFFPAISFTITLLPSKQSGAPYMDIEFVDEDADYTDPAICDVTKNLMLKKVHSELSSLYDSNKSLFVVKEEVERQKSNVTSTAKIFDHVALATKTTPLSRQERDEYNEQRFRKIAGAMNDYHRRGKEAAQIVKVELEEAAAEVLDSIVDHTQGVSSNRP